MSDEKSDGAAVGSTELLALLEAGEDLNSIVDGPFNVRWTHNGVRLTDAPQWCTFYVALQKALRSAVALMLIGFLAGCAALDTTYEILTIFDKDEEPRTGTVILDDGTKFNFKEVTK